MKKLCNRFYIIIALALLPLFYVSGVSYAQNVYTSEELFTIPWGEQPGELSQKWLNWDMCPPPGPSALSPDGGFVIADYAETTERLAKYSLDGTLIGAIDLRVFSIPMPSHISIAHTGEVLLAIDTRLTLLSSDLEILFTETVPLPHAHVAFIWRSENGGFWCIYDLSSMYDIKRYLVEYNLDGSMSSPQLLFSGEPNDQERYNYEFISPTGENSRNIKDMHGYIYMDIWKYPEGSFLKKRSPENELIYTYVINYDPNCKGTSEYYIDWNGDFYTLHPSAQGEVLTKFDLHHDPVCDLLVITPRPHTGPSPVAVEFDASGTYDDDGDTLTFHWDFDGDKVFDEPIDDAYTGTPSNPTHEYTADYEGAVNLRVTDNYQGECDIAVILSVDVQQWQQSKSMIKCTVRLLRMPCATECDFKGRHGGHCEQQV